MSSPSNWRLPFFLLRVLYTAISANCWTPINSKVPVRLNLDDLCQTGGTEIDVQDAVTVTWKPHDDVIASSERLDNSTHHTNNVTIPVLPIQCKVTFNLAPENGAFFMVTLRNHLPINRDRCMAWNPLMKIWSNKQALGLGCVRKTARFFDPPITLTANTFILHSLLSRRGESSFSMVITAVTFECDQHSNGDEGDNYEWPLAANWWPCSVHERYCIQRKLFCDSVNNCGGNEDEDKRLCNFWPSDDSHGDNEETHSRETGYILQHILRKYDKSQDAFSLTLFAQDDKNEAKNTANWQSTFIPITASFFVILFVVVLGCLAYICWTKHRNQRLQRNFIDYVIKYRRAAGGGNRLGVLGFDAYPFAAAGNAFSISTEEAIGGMEWSAEHRSLLGRRR